MDINIKSTMKNNNINKASPLGEDIIVIGKKGHQHQHQHLQHQQHQQQHQQHEHQHLSADPTSGMKKRGLRELLLHPQLILGTNGQWTTVAALAKRPARNGILCLASNWGNCIYVFENVASVCECYSYVATEHRLLQIIGRSHLGPSSFGTDSASTQFVCAL